ncbi:MAG: hypothetical protein ACODAD_12500 [Planctomycetota bacterium]
MRASQSILLKIAEGNGERGPKDGGRFFPDCTRFGICVRCDSCDSRRSGGLGGAASQGQLVNFDGV